ncbi:hypothetical protein GGI23_000069 [Coemansia sp. RSA 2559]|nr:hypothetical protein GGI23_000069 [Coemansia sp. RSA 2559]KAJ2869690.1 hypothetical protein GGI22_000090 [Coemansia erecta]
MWTNTAPKKTSVVVDLFTPQVTVTSGSETNLLLGYVDVTLERPTEVKYIKVSFTGTYSAFWNDGMDQARNEYYQNKLFHNECISLTRHHLQTPGSSMRRRPVEVQPLELCLRRADRGWETVSLESNSDTDEPDFLVHQDMAGDLWSAPKSPPPPLAPSLSGSSWSRRRYNDDMDLAVSGGGFTLPSGKHRFRFNMRLPSRMPSTITSAAGGGIEYTLTTRFKSKGSLGIPIYNSASCPVRVVNLPSRFAELQASLPVNDEAIFTRQIDNAWWILARLSSCTVSPMDSLVLSITLAWPSQCKYKEDVSKFVEVASVQMDLHEHTVYRSLASGTVIKKIKVPVATSIDGVGEKVLPVCLNSDAVGVKEGSASSSTSSEGHIRAMFNEDFQRVFQLKVPIERGSRNTKGVHIDCRSVPICVSHELQMSIQIVDKATHRMHLVPFHSRIVVVPEAESFYLPAYTSSRLDARVL